MVDIRIDATALARIERQLNQLPRELRHRVVARAMKRVSSMGNTRIVRDVANLTQVAQKHARSRIDTYYGVGDLSLDTKVKSKWIPLIELGGRRMNSVLRSGKKTRGSYRAAFLATVKGRESVWRRQGAARGPLAEQFGPNLAHAVAGKEDRYSNLLGEVIQSHLLPCVLHEIGRALADLK